MAEMSGLPRRAARQRAADVLYQVGLDEERYRLIKGFSTGMKQRVKLAQAIVHDPELVFLDEPTNGLDPLGREEMLDLIERIHRQLGILVVLSSHILDDVERVCDYVVVLDGGRWSRPSRCTCRTTTRPICTSASTATRSRFLRAARGSGIAARPAGHRVHVAMSSSSPATATRTLDAIRDAAADDRLAAASAAAGDALARRPLRRFGRRGATALTDDRRVQERVR